MRDLTHEELTHVVGGPGPTFPCPVENPECWGIWRMICQSNFWEPECALSN
jgi:hypothetical protein